MSEQPKVDDAELKRLREERKKQKEAEKAAKAAKAKEKPQWNLKKDDQGANKDGGKGGDKKKKEKEEKPKFVNTTPAGEKKPLNTPLATAYDPPAVEAAWYAWWEKKGFFSPEYLAPGRTQEENDKRERFVMVIPPPNVTGSLHIGHALTNSIEDALARWHRMLGHEVLWVPGTDHAGIATQSVVEKMLWKNERLTKDALGREKFVERVWAWKQEYGHRITTQLRRIGSSVDWTREVFTMDERRSKAVTEAFVRVHDLGLIYRANRLVNWSCALRTAISDIEVDDEELEGPTKFKVPGHSPDKLYPFGQIWSFAYKVVPGPDVPEDAEIVVATTRPETMLGDTAVAVHPDDPRYKHLHGKHVQHPFLPRTIPIVCDPILVDMSFGTGAVKVTPAHDPNDYEVGVRHNLPFINILNEDGSLNDNAGPYKGMMRFDAREKVLADLEQRGLYRGVAPNKMVLGRCSRSGDIIEPFLKPQWYVDIAPMAKRAADAVRNKELKLVPERHESTWFHYLDNPRPWCVSRQLWWGHRVPAYRVIVPGNDKELWVVARSEAEAAEKARALPEVSAAGGEFTLMQDEDVLDTWFSSALFPFSVMGWPDQTRDLERFYPTTLLETGQDILFFWVSKMVMMGLTLTDKLPFTTTLLHTIVRDAHGRKMSKSLGNVIDPVDVIEGITLEGLHAQLLKGNLREDEIEKARKGQKEDFPDGIAECGTDALRFALCAYTGQGKDINLDIKRVVAYREFCNKLWQAFRLSSTFLAGYAPPATAPVVPPNASRMDAWILSRLEAATRAVDAAFRAYDLGSVTSVLHAWWLKEFCAVYLEVIKPVMKGSDTAAQDAVRATLYTCVDEGLRLLAPFMPYLTEELWQRLARREGDLTESIHVAAYPLPREGRADPTLDTTVAHANSVVSSLRNVAQTYNVILRSQQPSVTVACSDEQTQSNLEAFLPALLAPTGLDAAKVSYVQHKTLTTPPAGCATQIVDHSVTLFVQLAGLVDAAKEIEKLEKKLAQQQKTLEALTTRMAGADYKRVPESVQQQDAEKKGNLEAEVSALTTAIATFRALQQ